MGQDQCWIRHFQEQISRSLFFLLKKIPKSGIQDMELQKHHRSYNCYREGR